MNVYFLSAGILCILLGIAHSVIGEYLIFHPRRVGNNLVPTASSKELRERHLRILWATWHLATVFGAGFGLLLMQVSAIPNAATTEFAGFMIAAIQYVMLAGSLLVLVATRGKHPGWFVLLCIAILLWMG